VAELFYGLAVGMLALFLKSAVVVLPPFPVIHPGVTRDRIDLLCYACFVPLDL
jgi:hypothetical protein